MRADKFIWTVRLSKTRNIAAKLCLNEKVKVNDKHCKGAKLLLPGDKISIKSIPIWRSYCILQLPKSRIGAKLVDEYLTETTSKSDLQLLSDVQKEHMRNGKLAIKGRPTKKARRDLQAYTPIN